LSVKDSIGNHLFSMVVVVVVAVVDMVVGI
jgi:hypothetical protein